MKILYFCNGCVPNTQHRPRRRHASLHGRFAVYISTARICARTRLPTYERLSFACKFVYPVVIIAIPYLAVSCGALAFAFQSRRAAPIGTLILYTSCGLNFGRPQANCEDNEKFVLFLGIKELFSLSYRSAGKIRASVPHGVAFLNSVH